MKRTFLRPPFSRILAAALFLLAPAATRAEHYKLFVLTGQSNSLGTTNGSEPDVSPGSDPADSRVKFWWHNVADATTSIGNSGGAFTGLQAQQGGYYAGSATHWGPEIGFGRTLVRAGVGNVIIVKASRGGGGNTLWSKTSGGHMYSHVVSTVNEAAAALTGDGHTFETAGLLYLQGESDNAFEAENAGTRLLELIGNLRTDLPNASGMKVVVGGIAASGADRDKVRAGQQAAAAGSAAISFFPNVDLRDSVTDGLHFDRAAKLRIGERFAQAFFAHGTVSRHYGKLVFIGDSITQGGNGDHPSYRYQVFKRLAEQGVPIDPVAGYKFTGSVIGPQTTPVLTTPAVNGQAFENVHDGHYGWRASWINARVRLPSNRRSSNRGEGTLLNWTGQASPQTYNISGPDQTVPYPDPSASGTGNTGVTYVPDTASVMIGINDLADNNAATGQLVDDIATMIDQLRAANPQVRIFINRILYTNQAQSLRNAVDTVNGMLPGMITAKNAASPASPVWLVDASTGFDPVTMTYDAIHPNAVGEAYVGDRIAAALGVIETPGAPEPEPPPHLERDSAAFGTRHEGHQIWNGSAFVNGWTQVGELTKSLPDPTDLRVIHPAAEGRWLEGSAAGWTAVVPGSWTAEVRLKCNANANGVMLWFGTGSHRILVEVHGNRTQDFGGEFFNAAHDNLDGEFHVFRVVNDAPNGKYHVFRDGQRISPVGGSGYDQNSADNRLIIGDYTAGTFGNGFDITIDHVRFTPGAWLPPGVDSDGNGMPDAWEYEYFEVLTGTDPDGDADGDGFTNLEEFQNGTNPLIADASSSTLPVFLLAGAGNAQGATGETPLRALPPGTHPAEQEGGVWFHDGDGWKVLSAATDGSHGPEIAFARLLWDAGHREFGIVKSTTLSGGNSAWVKGGSPDNAYDLLVNAASTAAAAPPGEFTGVNFRALLYVQGEENDAVEADSAATRFATLLDHLRSDLPGAAGMQAILGEIGGSGANCDTTRARHSALAAERSDIGYARATGASLQNPDGPGIHYDADGIHLLGARFAAEAFDLGLVPAPLPAWANVHAWFVADHATAFDINGAIARWGNVRQGSAGRDLARRVAGETYRRSVTSGSGHAREVMRFDGTNDLWSNASTEFGAIAGARSVAILCRVTSDDDGYLFDGSTGTGKSRVQIRNGRWQVGVATASDPWNGAENNTVETQTQRWQQHVFVYTPAGGGTAIEHWIDGELAGTASDPSTANLGGFMLGSNGGSPFSRIKADVAEVAVFASALGQSEIASLKSAWDARWGSPTGPPFSVLVTQNPREIARFGRHELVSLKIDTPSSTTVEGISVHLAPGTSESIESLAVVNAESRATLAVFEAPVPDSLSIPLSVSLEEGSHQIQIVVVPERYAALGTVLDASIAGVTVDDGEEFLPDNADPSGVVTLGLVPQFTDVVKSGDLGINTFRIPGMVADGRGVMHAVYDQRYDHSGDLPANIDVGYSRSTDGGVTWTTSRVIMDFDGTVAGSSGNGVGDPCILHDPVTDTLWVAALWSFGNRAYNGSGPGLTPAESGQYVLVKSEDGGETWSAPINITAQVKDPAWRLIFCGPGHGLAMRDGTLVFPSQYRDENGTVRVCSVYSTDHGQSWKFGSAVPTSSPQTNENTVCELDDGRLLFSMRTPSGSNGQRAWIHYSPGGETAMSDGQWSSLFRLPTVPDPVCQGSVIQWTSRHRGDPRELVVFGNPASSSSRVNFTLRVSADGGNSWPVSRLLYGGPSAYSSICILPDRSIGVLFEKDNYSKITFARVEADWLLDPSVDSDGDGMPDAWELLNGLNPSAADGDDDSDGDGFTNLDEYSAGTDPLDGSSALVATAFTQEDDESWRFEWHAVPGKSYLIESSDDLESWSPVLQVLADRVLMGALIPTETAAPRKFVRARVVR